MKTHVGFAEFLAEVESVGANLILKDVDNLLERTDKLIVIDVVDKLQVDADDVLEGRSEELDCCLMVEQLDQSNSCVDSDWEVWALEALE